MFNSKKNQMFRILLCTYSLNAKDKDKWLTQLLLWYSLNVQKCKRSGVHPSMDPGFQKKQYLHEGVFQEKKLKLIN